MKDKNVSEVFTFQFSSWKSDKRGVLIDLIYIARYVYSKWECPEDACLMLIRRRGCIVRYFILTPDQN